MEIPQALAYKRIYGIQYSPNEQADRLEGYLGVTFAEKPRKVIITPRNRVAIFVNSLLPPFRNLGLLNRALETEPTIGGTYEPDYNLMFVKDNSPFTILHENMHAFANQVNPAFFGSGIKADADVLSARMGRRPHLIGEAEKAWLVKIFDEGIAETGALHILFDRNNLQTDKIVEPYDLSQASDLLPDMLYLRDILDGIMAINAVITRRDIIERMTDEIIKRTRVYEPINWDDPNIYFQLRFLGVYFCQGTLNELRRNGLTIAQAFTNLLKNPPTALGQLKDPVSFAQGL